MVGAIVLVLVQLLAPPALPGTAWTGAPGPPFDLEARTSAVCPLPVSSDEPLLVDLTADAEVRVRVVGRDGALLVEWTSGGERPSGWSVLRPRPADVGSAVRVEVTAGEVAARRCALEVVRVRDALDRSLAAASQADASGTVEDVLLAYEDVLDFAAALGDDRTAARAERRLARYYTLGGFLDVALRHAESLLRRARALGDESAELEALLRAGSILQRSGDLPRAVDRLEEALARARASGAHDEELFARWNLLVVRQQTGEFEASLEGLRELREEARAVGHARLEGLAANGVGNALLLLGRPGDALEPYRAWRQLCRSAGDRWNEAVALVCIGNVHRRLGRPDEAIAAYREAWDVVGERGPPDMRATVAGTIASSEADAGRIHRAREWLDRCRRFVDPSSGAEPRFALGLAAVKVAVAERDPAAARAALGELEEIVDRLASDGLTPDQRAGFRAYLGAAPLQVQEVVRLSVEVAPADAARRRAVADGFHATGRWKARSLLLELAGHGGAPLESVSVSEVREAVLTPARAWIEYARGPRRLYAYVVTPERAEFVPLSAWEDVEPEVAAFRRAVGDPDRLAPLEEVRERGHDLYLRLLAPLLVHLDEDVRELIVVPPRGLALFPFEALVTTGSGPLAFVADRYAVTTGPSAAVLVALARRQPRAAGRDLLVLVDPADGGPRPRLPGTREEAFAVVDALAPGAGGRVRAALAGDDVSLDDLGVVLHAGRAATAGRLVAGPARFRWMHLATHGAVDPLRPARTGLHLADGLFGLDDVAGLRLDAELVVLSACDTAGGRAVSGEGVRSLSRAFLVAGARAVVANRWAVSDRASAEFMRAFYDALGAGTGPAAALREAGRAFRAGEDVAARRRRGVGSVDRVGAAGRIPACHPFLWASFQYVGLP